MTSIGTRVDLIQNLKKSSNAAFVKQAIEIGNHLIEIKAELGCGVWGPFAKETFGFSLRTCQEYMKVARYSIHENHYKYGLRGLIDMMNTDTDLSHPSINRYCQGCKEYKNCLLISNNQTGNCPCSKCETNGTCFEMCDDMYGWSYSIL